MPAKSSTWYLKTPDGSVFGPVNATSLKDWAEDGRIAPDHHVSNDQVQWIPAPEKDWLAMDWEVTFPSGETFGPLNMRAIGDLLIDGTVHWDYQVRNVRNNAESTPQELAPEIFGTTSPGKKAVQTKKDAALLRSIDDLEKEVCKKSEEIEKLKKKAETQREKREKNEKTWGESKSKLQAEVKELKEDLKAAKTDIKELTKVVKQQEKQASEQKQGAEKAQLEVATERDKLNQELAAKTTELESARQAEEALKSELEEQTSKVTSVNTALEEAHETLAAERQKREEHLAEAAQREAKLREDLARKEADYSALSDTYSQAKEALGAELAGLTSEAEKANLALEEARSALEAERREKDSATAEAVRREADIEALLEEQKAAYCELSDSSKQAREELKEARSDLERERVESENRLAESFKKEKELDETLAEQLKLHEQEIEGWQSRETMLLKKIDQLQCNCEAALAETDELRKRLETEHKAPRNNDRAHPLVNLENQVQSELKKWMTRQ